MATKEKRQKLSDEQREQIKELALKGVAPQDISEQFGTPISTIHAMKKAWTERDNIKFPNLRGQRPKGHTQAPVTNLIKSDKRSVNDKTIGVVTGEGMKFIVNGKSVIVGPGSKQVSIEEDQIVVTF